MGASLTYFMPLVSFYTPSKHQKPGDIEERYRKKPVAWNRLKPTSLNDV